MHWMNRGSLLRGHGRSIHVSLCYMNIYEGWMFKKISLWIFVTASWQLHTHIKARTLSRTRTCTCHHRKKSTDKSINKLANKTLSLLFWACLSVRLSVHCCGHSNLVIFNQIFFPNFISSSNSRSILNTFFFCRTISKKAVKMAATTGLSNLVIIIGFLPNFIYGLRPSNSRSICS